MTFLDDESMVPAVEEAPVEIVLARLNEDGTTAELRLEGDLEDARALAATLEAEGNCVTVEIAQPGGEGREEEAETPGASEATPESAEGVVESTESPVPASP